MAWRLYVDGSSTKDGSGAGILLVSPEKKKEVFQYSITFGFSTYNNAAEYEALIAGLEIAEKVGAKTVLAHTDYQLVAKQIAGEIDGKDPSLSKYRDIVLQLMTKFTLIPIRRIPRIENGPSDALSKIAS